MLSCVVHISIVVAWLVASPVSSQVIRGTIVDDGSGIGVKGIYVVLLTSDDRMIVGVFSDSVGHFSLVAPAAGLYRVRANGIGYESATSDRFEVTSSSAATIVLRIVLMPVVFDSLKVETELRVPHLERAGFYRRKWLGSGYFLTRHEIASRAATRIIELLYSVPGVRVVEKGPGNDEIDVITRGRCRPILAVDGLVVRRGDGGGLEVLPHPSEVEGIEIYPGAILLPAQIAGGGPSPCGAIIIWTQR